MATAGGGCLSKLFLERAAASAVEGDAPACPGELARKREGQGRPGAATLCAAWTMASSPRDSTAGKGAAEEPEPEPDPPSNSSAPASYDPRDYQPPHPDDRAGGDGKPTQKGGKGPGSAKGKGKGKDGTHRCGNCDAPDAKRKCMGCGVERYCGEECQKVRAVRCVAEWIW